MHFRHPPTLLLLLLLVLLQCFRYHACDDWRYADQLELIRFVLNHDVEWRPVLEQRILLAANRRPTLARLDRIDPNDAKTARIRASASAMVEVAKTPAVAPLIVLRTVARDLAWCGSYVEFAGFMLRQAFTCVVYGHMFRVTQTIGTLKNRPLDEIRHALIRIRSALTAIADSLVAVDGHPDAMAQLCNIIDGWLTDNAMGQQWFLIIVAMGKHIEQVTTSHCEAPAPSPPSSPPPDVNALSNQLLAFYDRLAVSGSVAPGSWTQVLDYRQSYANGVFLKTAANDWLDAAKA